MISTEGLRNKEVINITDGRSLGFVGDIEVNLDLGRIEGIVLPAERGVFGFFSSGEEDVVISWESIRTIGEDVILVEIANL
ncbi:MAG: YlmC/YmxH family sporulation protein [Clostridiales bacterium]|nr:YlmC/YmxH family sporulation protein [Clostridiales bacterium]MBQ2748084.1 YlmC/YmxH family sporulation protein [Bacillota bacterium]